MIADKLRSACGYLSRNVQSVDIQEVTWEAERLSVVAQIGISLQFADSMPLPLEY
jgi:hypothetical protein